MSLNKRREIEYSLAINEALHQTMEDDKDMFLIGQGVKSPWYVGNTCQGLIEKFKENRVIDTPVSENAMTGMAVGAAISGNRTVVVHPRMDFMLYGFDPIINQAANWYYMSGGNISVPIVFWGIINRGGEQAAQHSQSLHSIFAHIPGLKVVMPSNSYDAKGLMVSAILDPNPVVFIDDRLLYGTKSFVPEELYSIEIGKANIKREGKDITIIANSYMSHLSEQILQRLDSEKIYAELIDLRTIKPIDKETILNSVAKTKRVVILDGGWKSYGLSAEIAAIIAESGITLEQPLSRIALPDTPAPASTSLEKEYYYDENKLFLRILQSINNKKK